MPALLIFSPACNFFCQSYSSELWSFLRVNYYNAFCVTDVVVFIREITGRVFIATWQHFSWQVIVCCQVFCIHFLSVFKSLLCLPFYYLVLDGLDLLSSRQWFLRVVGVGEKPGQPGGDAKLKGSIVSAATETNSFLLIKCGDHSMSYFIFTPIQTRSRNNSTIISALPAVQAIAVTPAANSVISGWPSWPVPRSPAVSLTSSGLSSSTPHTRVSASSWVLFDRLYVYFRNLWILCVAKFN